MEERTDTGLLLLCMPLAWFWCSSEVPSGVLVHFCPFVVPPTFPHAVFGAHMIQDLFLSAPNPSIFPLVHLTFWFAFAVPQLNGDVRRKPALLFVLLLQQWSSRRFWLPPEPLFPSQCSSGLHCTSWGHPRAFHLPFGAPM